MESQWPQHVHDYCTKYNTTYQYCADFDQFQDMPGAGGVAWLKGIAHKQDPTLNVVELSQRMEKFIAHMLTFIRQEYNVMPRVLHAQVVVVDTINKHFGSKDAKCQLVEGTYNIALYYK